jgi:argininosuccinate lyase
MAEKSRKAWGGRFEQETDRLMEEFNASIGFDRRLWREDIEGSRAYAEALARQGIITEEEAAALVNGLEQVAGEIERGEFVWREADEDVHMAVERRLTELAGPVGGKLHTGRSRNDQVATDMRLWMLKAADSAGEALKALQRTLLDRARPHLETLMPGFTHFQQAQVVSLAHYLLSFFWMFERDCDRFRDLRRRTAVLPLGSGALAGHALGIDREFLAARLGFDKVSPNSMDAVSDRDFVVEFISDSALVMTHLSRLAEDLILFSSSGLRFVTLSDAFTTGSSLMPQKKNPDALELVRGKAGRVIGRLAGLLATLKGLPSTYNKDLQEDKEPLFDTFDTLSRSLAITERVVATLEFRPETMAASLDDFLLATDLADYLVRRGLPFRSAHEVAGRLVRECEQRRVSLRDLPVEVYRGMSELFEPDVKETLRFETSLRMRSTEGGAAPDAVRRQLAQAEKALG